ncbi:MAG: hypothetical protein FWH11_04035 [Micrococcales bacterium]|nr:hypothetical protein [Micrococcales bacterium]
MERMQTVSPQTDVTNRVSEVPTQWSPSEGQPTETRSLVPHILVTGGYAALVGLTTAILCAVS